MQTRQLPSEKAADRRVQKTRNALRLAMMELMVDTGWDAMEIQMLCERANIGRSTFYEHYPSKEALLAANFMELQNTLLKEPASASAQEMPFLSGLLNHVYESRDVFRALLGRRSGQYVQLRFKEFLMALLETAPPVPKAPKWQASARAHFLAGALFEVLVWWLGSNRPHKPADIEILFRQWSHAAAFRMAETLPCPAP